MLSEENSFIYRRLIAYNKKIMGIARFLDTTLIRASKMNIVQLEENVLKMNHFIYSSAHCQGWRRNIYKESSKKF